MGKRGRCRERAYGTFLIFYCIGDLYQDPETVFEKAGRRLRLASPTFARQSAVLSRVYPDEDLFARDRISGKVISAFLLFKPVLICRKNSCGVVNTQKNKVETL